jgi:hypothetical protein
MDPRDDVNEPETRSSSENKTRPGRLNQPVAAPAGVRNEMSASGWPGPLLQLVSHDLHRPGRITLHPVRELFLREGEELPGIEARARIGLQPGLQSLSE